MRTLLSLWLLSWLLAAPAPAQTFEWLRGGTYDESVPTPKAVLGYEIGEYLTDNHQMVEYIRRLAAATRRVKVVEYGRSIERRTLYLVIVSSPKNMERLEEIRTTVARLADPRTTSEAEAQRIADTTPAIAWLNYGTDGNETSAFETAIQVAYQLAAGTDPLTTKILDSTVIVLNPCLSPDSHQWFATWAKAMTVGKPGTADPAAAEHHSLWFTSSDGNHYFIDVNRDAFALSQPETQQVVAALRHWNPQVWVDNHGQPDEYFFTPPVTPVNLNYPQSHLKWLTEVGRNAARYFDRYGWTFVKDEVYDLYYPGYWDAYPSFQGALGMTFESDGGGTKGFVWERPDKSLVTLRDSVHHHFNANLATLEVLVDNRPAIMRDFYGFRKSGMDEADKEPIKYYVFQPGPDPGRARALVETLMRHGIEVYRTGGQLAAQRTQTYFDRQVRPRQFPPGSYVVPMKQPQKRLAKVLLEPDPRMEERFLKIVEETRALNKKLGSAARPNPLGFYDVTAWCLPLTHGVETALVEDVLSLAAEWRLSSAPPLEGGVSGGRAGYAYLLPSGDGGAKIAGRLLQEGYRVAVALRPFTNGGREHGRGTFVARVERNPGTLHARVAELASAYGVNVHATGTAWGEPGISLGSRYVVPLEPPRIMVVTDEPTGATAYGAVYALLEQRFDLAFTAVRGQQVAETDLSRYNVIIFPDGSAEGYERLLGERGVRRLKAWIEEGGTFIGIKNGAAFSTRKGVELTDVKLVTEVPDRSSRPGTDAAAGAKDGEPPLKRVESMPGSIFRAAVNTDYHLGAGLAPEIAVQVRGNWYLSKSKRGTNVVTFPASSFLMGHRWEDTERVLEDQAYMVDVPSGSGRVILFGEDPTFRAYWRGLDRLFMNAVLMGPSVR